MKTIKKAINKDPNSLLYKQAAQCTSIRNESHQILTFSFLGNKEKLLQRTRKRERETEAERGLRSGPSSTHVLILLFVAVEVAHHRFGFPSIWPFLAFSLVPTFLLFFIELDFHLNRLCYSENKTDSNEESQGTHFHREMTNQRCRSVQITRRLYLVSVVLSR